MTWHVDDDTEDAHWIGEHCNDGEDGQPAVCYCPTDHPVLQALLVPVWWLMPGRWQAAVVGDPCWAGQ